MLAADFAQLDFSARGWVRTLLEEEKGDSRNYMSVQVERGNVELTPSMIGLTLIKGAGGIWYKTDFSSGFTLGFSSMENKGNIGTRFS